MNEHKKLINSSSDYHVFLFSCPAVIPLSFLFDHSWFVCVRKNKASRWEVRFEKNTKNPISGKHLHLNTLDPFIGTGKIAYIPDNYFWSAKLIKHIEGDENSLASRMYHFIEDSSKNYIDKDKYWFLGPNCNTYTQWVLDNFPEFNIKLSARFIGNKKISLWKKK